MTDMIDMRRWSQGCLLVTPDTVTWREAERQAVDAEEKRSVFAGFSSIDLGRSRQFICSCDTPEQAIRVAELHNTLIDLLQKSF